MKLFWITMTVLFFFISIFVTSIIFSGIVIHSRRQPIVHHPAEYGMVYENIVFQSTDGLTLKGWLISAPSQAPIDKKNRVIILTHAMPFNRHGFVAKNQGFPPLFKTDVDLLKTAQALNREGYPILMFDLRNHGESDNGITGNGLTEYQDILGAVRFVNQHPSFNQPQIGFVSFCMGAASTMVALSKGKDQLGNVRFFVAIQPVSSKVFFRSYMRKTFTPLSLFIIPIVEKLVLWRGGYSFEAMSPLAHAKDIEIPVFYIQAKGDPWTELDDIQSFYDASAGPKELWLVEGIKKRFEMYNYIGEHPQRVIDFVNQNFDL
jgi:pimeloyl-ACP methyl ester carboxylesterase